jgi:hypothetical protein
MDSDPLVIGIRETWGQEVPFGFTQKDRRHHVYVVGQTGAGKSTLLGNMIVQDIRDGRGVAFIDPHGDLAEELLNCIPSRRIEDVVYFNPADDRYPIGFNLLRSKASPHLIASGVVGAFKGIWRESWGPRLEYILYAAVAALAECDNVSLLSLQRMLSDSRYRAWVVKQINDPLVRSFWVNEFEGYDRSFLREAIAPIQNKVGQLLMSPQIRNILGQVATKIDARFIMDNRRIFIANLSKGRLGEDKSNLLGALLVAQFQLAAMSRADVPEQQRTDYNLFVDEFQSFTSDSFASILSEARKYGLCLTLSHQYIEQVKPEIREAVFGNVASLIAFRVGQTDAEILERQFGNVFPGATLTSLPNFQVCAKVLSGGEVLEPFLGKTLVPQSGRCGGKDTIIRRSREKYATRRQIVENRIRRWMGHTKR